MGTECAISNDKNQSQGTRQFREMKHSPTKVDPIHSLNSHCRGRAHQASFTHSLLPFNLFIYLFIAQSLLSSSCQQDLRKAFALSKSHLIASTLKEKPSLFPLPSHNSQDLFSTTCTTAQKMLTAECSEPPGATPTSRPLPWVTASQELQYSFYLKASDPARRSWAVKFHIGALHTVLGCVSAVVSISSPTWHVPTL